MTLQCTPGWAQTVATPARGFAMDRVGLAGVDTQCDVMTRWEDGLIRQALMTAKIATAGAYALVADPTALTLSPMPTPVWPSAVVTMAIGGTPYVAALPAFTDVDRWTEGPLVKERSVIVVPRTAAGASHALIQVIFDVASFRDGASLIDIQVINSRDHIEQAIVPMTIAIVVNGAMTYGPKAHILHQGNMFIHTTSTGGYVESRVDPDPEMYFAAGVFPRFIPDVSNKDYVAPVGDLWTPALWDTQSVPVLGFGTLVYSMSSPGGRAELAPYPDVQVEYLMHRKPSQRAMVLAQGNLAGSWCGYLMRDDGVTPIRLSDEGQLHYQIKSRRGFGTAIALEAPHITSLTYLPYLLTGRRRYLRLTQAWACNVLWSVYDDPAQNVSQHSPDVDLPYSRNDGGMLCNLASSFAAEPRGLGWALRNATDAAVITPDRETATKAYLTKIVAENVAWLDRYALRPQRGLFGAPFAEIDPGGGNGTYGGVHEGYCSISFWQHSYLNWALHHAAEQGFSTTRAFQRKLEGALVKLFTLAPREHWPRLGALHFPRFELHNLREPQHFPFTSWDEFFNHNYMPPPAGKQSNPQDMLAPPWPRNPGPPYYAAEYRMVLIHAERNGIPGATAALDWIDNDYGGRGAAASHSGYGIARAGEVPTPEPLPEPPVVPPSTAEQIVGQMTVRAAIVGLNEVDPDLSDNTTEIVVDVYADVPTGPPIPPAPKQANVRIMRTSIGKVKVGSTFVVTYRMDNAGPDDATNHRGGLLVPAGAAFMSALPSYGSIAVVDGVPTWTVDRLLARGSGVTCTVTYRAVSVP